MTMIHNNVPFHSPARQVFIIGPSGLPGATETTAAVNFWHHVKLPQKCSMVYIWCCGAGAGGNGGTTTTGGGGGGSGATFRTLIPRVFLPEYIYVTVGQGTAGGTAALTSRRGGDTIVSTAYLNTNAAPASLHNIAHANGGGSNATSASAGAAGAVQGSGATIVSTAYGMLITAGSGTLAGQNGGAGAAAGAAGTAVTYPTTGLFLSGGCGGGGAGAASNAGGNVNMPSNTAFPQITGGAAGGTTNGSDGLSILPFYDATDVVIMGSVLATQDRRNYTASIPANFQFPLSTGGAGGGGSSTTGSKGGDGGFGSGGGGGGGGTTAGGPGGKGGDGLCIIVCF